jgi:hypothetical protein
METFNTRIPRELAVQYGEQAVQIMRQGVYRAPSGRNVTIADLVERSAQGTISYPPEIPPARCAHWRLSNPDRGCQRDHLCCCAAPTPIRTPPCRTQFRLCHPSRWRFSLRGSCAGGVSRPIFRPLRVSCPESHVCLFFNRFTDAHSGIQHENTRNVPSLNQVVLQMRRHRPAIVRYQDESVLLAPNQNIGVKGAVRWRADVSNLPDNQRRFAS